MTALAGSHTQLLINARTDVALACGAHGVHLPANDLAASDVRAIFARARSSELVIGVSTHSAAEVASAEAHGANFAVFGPVFEKSGSANREGLTVAADMPSHRSSAAADGGLGAGRHHAGKCPAVRVGGSSGNRSDQVVSAE